MKDFVSKVAKIQATLKAPKGQMNKFGNYRYRSCEDILEAVKPLLENSGIILTVSDEVVVFAENSPNPRFYVKAIATLTDGINSVTNTALARESEEKKGMDTAQVTGACSSYARKYALNGLLLIDDTKDADATETHGKEDAISKFNKQNSVTTASTPTTSKLSPDKAVVPSITEKPMETVSAAAPAKKGGWSSRKTAATAPATTTKGDLY